MNRSRSGLATALVAMIFVVVAGAARAQQERYLYRLSVPVAGDEIGYGGCVTADPRTGESFVCDPRANRIVVFDPEGYFDAQILGGDDFRAPQDLAVDPEGLLVVLAYRERRPVMVELDFDGLFRREIPLVGLPRDAVEPWLVSMALSPDGQSVYLLDSANRILWMTDRDGLVLASADLGRGLDEESLRDLAFGHVDAYGERVLVAVPSLAQVWVYSADAKPLAQVGLRGGSRCLLGRPSAAALDERGRLLVLDEQRMVLLRWSIEKNECLSEHLGIGQTPGALYYPFDLSLDPRGRFYISQSFEGRVQVYDGLGAAPAAPQPVTR